MQRDMGLIVATSNNLYNWVATTNSPKNTGDGSLCSIDSVHELLEETICQEKD